MDYSAGQIGGIPKSIAPQTRAQSLLSRLSAISGNLTEHIVTLEGLEAQVVGAAPPEAEATAERDSPGRGYFLAELEAVVRSLEEKLPSARTSVSRISSAF